MLEFNEEKHEYTLDGKKLISVTQLMQKHGLAPNYSNVNADVLKAKAERGTLVHLEIEEYIKEDKLGFSDELYEFISYCRENNIIPLESELRVCNDIVAGTIDFIFKQDGKTYLADFKTTATLHKESVSWQESIYKALYNKPVDGLKAFHFSKDGLKVYEVVEKQTEEIEKLFSSERDSVSYEMPALVMDQTAIQELCDIENHIARLERDKKNLETREKELKEEMQNAMEKQGRKSFENDQIKVTYKDSYSRNGIDFTKLKKELPDVFNKYQKETKVSASIIINVKEENE